MRTASRLSVSLPSTLAARVRRAASRRRVPLSAWIAEAAEARLLLDRARSAIEAYERRQGRITEEELGRMERAWRA